MVPPQPCIQPSDKKMDYFQNYFSVDSEGDGNESGWRFGLIPQPWLSIG